MATFPGQPIKPAPQGKPFWILMKQEIMEWQWHQANHMQIMP